ncbi:MAG: fasciclin domain-containing protein [Leptolyngbyaceae cyanobacterium MO_188.B28]|nr:fasciclin domain-containing protein [Leptolyngbyaceae cyanobacterium MO_188.B28]
MKSTVFHLMMMTHLEGRFIQSLKLAGLTSLGLFLAIMEPAHSWRDRPGRGDHEIARQSIATPPVEATYSILAQAELDLVDAAVSHGALNTMIQLMEDLDLATILRGRGPFIVFAPTDDAFSAVPPDVMDALQTDQELMAKVLAYHMVRIRRPIKTDEITGTRALRTLERSLIELRRDGDGIFVNDATVIAPDIEASNGVIHVIDTMLIPTGVIAELR